MSQFVVKMGRFVILLGLGCLLPACGASPRGQQTAKSKPNILVLSVDALRPDHLGAYGYERDTSPEIDRLASEGAVFLNAYSQATWTLPSVASLFLSQYVSTHQVEHPKLRIPVEADTLAELLQRSGVETAAFMMGGYTSADFGMEQGFEVFETDLGKIEEKNRKLLEWLEQVESPFFAYAHYVDVHHPYTERLPHRESYGSGYIGTVDGERTLPGLQPELDEAGLEHLIDLYDDGISYTDFHLGRLFAALEELGLRSNTWIFLTADHGEAFLEHRNMVGHRGWPYEELIRVPLVVAGPGVPAGPRIAESVSAVDIAPTILDIMGVEESGGMQGLGFRSLLEGGVMAKHPVLAEMLPMSVKSIRKGNWKLLYDFSTATPELYDLATDPLEREDLASQNPDLVRDLLAALSEIVAVNHELAPDSLPVGTDWEEATRRQLLALGYLEARD